MNDNYIGQRTLPESRARLMAHLCKISYYLKVALAASYTVGN